MNNFVLCMMFWDDGFENSTRFRNLNFTWSHLKNLVIFLQKKGLDIECKLYDFSIEKKHTDAIHVPFQTPFYDRSKKLNFILDNNDHKFIMVFDCDVFFSEINYNQVYNLLFNINDNDIYTFDLAKLNELDTIKFLNGELENLFELDYRFAYSGDKDKGPLYHNTGGLGGVFLINRNLLSTYGRFNENKRTWGGEDGEALSNLVGNLRNQINIISVRDFFPFHLDHFTDWGNKNFYTNE